MKVKNLFRSLVVVALIVPFLFSLAACGKKEEYQKISADDAYKAVTAYVAARAESQVAPEKLTFISTSKMQMFDSVTTTKTIFGYDNTKVGETEETAENYFVLEYEDDRLTAHEFTATTKEQEVDVKKVYKFTSVENEEKPGEYTEAWAEPEAFENQFETAYTEYYTGLVAGILEGIASSLPATAETTFEDYKKAIEAEMLGDLPDVGDGVEFTKDDITATYEGRKYNDNSIGFVVTIKATVYGINVSAAQEFVVKDGKLIRASQTVVERYQDATLMTINTEYSFVDDYLSAQYVPTDLSNCVPATPAE